MFIAIDIGNTNITVSVYSNEEWQEFRISSEEVEPLAYYTQQLTLIAKEFDLSTIEGVGVSSVVPHLTDLILDATKIVLHKDPLLVQRKWYNLLPIGTDNPEELGTDLLLNALAGYIKVKGPCLIVDFGTALTYTLVNDKQRLEGVAISPGIKTAMKSLSGNAAQLPEIPLNLPEKALGKNTVEAMNAGILWGYVGQVQYMVDKICSSVDYKVYTIATGGLSEVLQPLGSTFDEIDRNLTVSGIYEFFKLVRAGRV
jgi:type III pantothenate kinase